MQREAIRLYSIGILAILLVMNIPEVATLLQQKFTVYQPQVSAFAEASYDQVSTAIIPLVGKIAGIPKVVINGKAAPVDTNDDFLLTHGQSLSIEQIDKILADAHSPAEGTGQYWLKYGIENDIDAAYGLAIFYQESGLGTNPAWYAAGYNTGNIICAGYWQCHGRFRDYSKDANPWASSIVDEMKLLRSYRDGGIKDWDAAIMKLAPPSENNTKGYIENTKTLIRSWRSTNRIIANDGGTVLQAVQDNGTKIPFGDAQSVSAPITADRGNDFGYNVAQALDNSNGALRNVTIKNGEQWSFNEAMGVPSDDLKWVSGVWGGGWCDLACRYVQALKGLGLHITHGTQLDADDIVFLQHGGIHLNNCTVDESPYIWSAGYKGFDNAMQDLIVNNRTGKTIRLIAVDNGDGTVSIAGKLE